MGVGCTWSTPLLLRSLSMKLQLANTKEVKRYYYDEVDEDGNVTFEDQETWIDVQAELTKKQSNGILRFAPKEDGNLEAGLRFIGKAFSDIIVGWSLYDEEGNMIPPTIEVYEELETSAAAWIDRTIGKHLRKVFGTDSENAEKKQED